MGTICGIYLGLESNGKECKDTILPKYIDRTSTFEIKPLKGLHFVSEGAKHICKLFFLCEKMYVLFVNETLHSFFKKEHSFKKMYT